MSHPGFFNRGGGGEGGRGRGGGWDKDRSEVREIYENLCIVFFCSLNVIV